MVLDIGGSLVCNPKKFRREAGGEGGADQPIFLCKGLGGAYIGGVLQPTSRHMISCCCRRQA